MENKQKQKQNYLSWIIVAVVVIIFAFYVISSNNKDTTNQTSDTSTSNNVPNVVAQQNQMAPAPVASPQKNAPTQTYTNFELSENPKYLYSKAFDPNKAKVYGVGIGDPVTMLDQASIVQQLEFGGWIHTTNGTGYRIVNGTIEEIALNNDGIANLISADEIIIKFGQPDRTTQNGTSPNAWTTYYYINRGIVVTDYQTGGIKVNIIGS